VVEGGFYEVGVLCALEEAVRGLALNALDVYVGVSSGALLSALLANGVSPRTLSRAVAGEAGPDLDLRPELLFDAAWGDYAAAALRAPRILVQSVRRLLARPMDESPYGLLMELGAAVPAGLFAGRAVEQYLARALASEGRTDDFRRLATKLRVVAVDLDSSELVDFGTPDTAHVPISRAVRASIALPGLYQPVEIDGRHYIDGVARRTMHASVALRDGARLLFCVNPIVPVDVRGPGGVSPRGPLVGYGLPAVLSQTFRTLVHSRMTTGLANYRHTHPDADVVLIEPALTDHRLFFSNVFSFTNRRGRDRARVPDDAPLAARQRRVVRPRCSRATASRCAPTCSPTSRAPCTRSGAPRRARTPAARAPPDHRRRRDRRGAGAAGPGARPHRRGALRRPHRRGAAAARPGTAGRARPRRPLLDGRPVRPDCWAPIAFRRAPARGPGRHRARRAA
jgi:predicted acylesterase/phospholipase RssA